MVLWNFKKTLPFLKRNYSVIMGSLFTFSLKEKESSQYDIKI